MHQESPPLIYLASESPRRQELLQQIGIPHTVLRLPLLAGEDEPLLTNERPIAYVQRTALDKARRAHKWLMEQILESVTNHDDRSGTNSTTGPGRTTKTLIKLPILCADTTVALDDMVLGKPIDAHNATHILEQLSGKTHTVYTAIVLATESGFHTDLSTSLVTFKSLSQKEIEHYVSTRDCFGKAGAYGIQGYAARFISHLHGSYSGVMGLPLYETTELLRAYNVVT